MIADDRPLSPPEVVTFDDEDLWEGLKGPQAQAVRLRLFDMHAGLAKSLARRQLRDWRSGDIDQLDLQQAASAGLLEAIDRYDPSKAVPFPAFARKRIVGSMLDTIAKASEFREQLSFYKRQHSERVTALRAAPARDAIEGYESFAEMVVGLAIGFMLEEDPSGEASAYDSLAWRETVEVVHRAVEALPDRERLILRGHYDGALTFDQIAGMLGVSKGRVSQLHRSALETLRKRLKVHNPFHVRR